MKKLFLLIALIFTCLFTSCLSTPKVNDYNGTLKTFNDIKKDYKGYDRVISKVSCYEKTDGSARIRIYRVPLDIEYIIYFSDYKQALEVFLRFRNGRWGLRYGEHSEMYEYIEYFSWELRKYENSDALYYWRYY